MVFNHIYIQKYQYRLTDLIHNERKSVFSEISVKAKVTKSISGNILCLYGFHQRIVYALPF